MANQFDSTNAEGAVQPIATRTIAGVEHQKMMVEFDDGASGATLASASTPLPVTFNSSPVAATSDSISAYLATGGISVAGSPQTLLTPKFAVISRATNADGAAVVNIVASKKIRVLRYSFVSAGTVSAKWQSATSNTTGAGVDTDLTGLMSFVANTGISENFSPTGLFETAAGEGLKLNLNAAVQVSGSLVYIEV